MASGTKILVSFCAMVIGVLVLYYGVIMPANEPVNPAGIDGTIPQKMAAANPKLETPVGSDTPGRSGQPVLIEPASARTDAPASDPAAPQPPATTPGGTESVSDQDGLLKDSLVRGPLDIVPVDGPHDAVDAADETTPAGVAETAQERGASQPPAEVGTVRPLDENGQPRPSPRSPASETPTDSAPSKPTTAPAQPANAPAMTEYVIKSGDTGVSIAKEWFGDGNKWVLISKANPWVDFNKLQIGQKIKLPPKNAPIAATKPAVAPETGTYVVQPGDTLIKIAREFLNDAGRWEEIYAANRKTIGDDPAGLQVGMKLTLPTAKTAKASAS